MTSAREERHESQAERKQYIALLDKKKPPNAIKDTSGGQ
jgi:hypothetical protein